MFIVPQYIQGVSFRIQRRHSSWVFFVCIWVSVQRDAHSNTSLSQVGFYRYNRETTIDTNLYLPHPNSAYNVSLNRIRIHTTSQCGLPTARPEVSEEDEDIAQEVTIHPFVFISL